jgi:endo-1,4-beta-D-glucanase Y
MDASRDAGSPAEASSGPADGPSAADGGPPPPSRVDAAAFGYCAPPPLASPDATTAAYAKWKNDLLTTSGARGFVRVLRPDSPGAVNTSNSEGTAYGMLLAVAMNDPATLDALWNYSQLFLDSNGLMNWEIDPNGNGPTSEGSGAATDADEDMAYALLWADARWGGKGSLSSSYRDLAVKQINSIWNAEVDHSRNDALAPGDQFGGASIVNISYFAPSYYRTFAKATGQSGWNNVVESSYSIVAASLNAANGNVNNGLVPAWCTPAGVPDAPSGKPTNYQLDSCRTPFRIGLDYCFFGEPRAKAYLAKISTFYSSVGAANIVDGYNLDGTPNPSHTTVHQSAAFVGPAAVGAMSDPMFAMLRAQAYAGVATLMELDGTTYYTESWTALSLVMLTGGFWNPAAP